MSTPHPDRERWLAPVDTPPAGLPDLDVSDVDPATVEAVNGAWSVEVAETDVEADLRDAAQDTPGGIAVDPDDDPQDGGRWTPPAQSRPLLPEWVRSDQRRQIVRWWVDYRAREAARLGLFLAGPVWWRAARRVPRGVGRTLAASWRWVFDHESLDLRRALGGGTNRHEALTYLAVAKQRNERVKRRGGWVLTAAAALAGYGAGVWWFGPWWLQLGSLALVVIVLGRVGSNPADPIIDRRTITPRVRKLTADVIERAFEAAGLASERKPISIPAPIHRDGPGWRAVIDLDYSFTAETAIKRRAQIAAGLDLDETMVWLDRVRGTAGSARRLSLWVADQDPFEQSAGPWPLAAAGTVNVFEPFPFGVDQRARTVNLGLMFTCVLIGSVPRIGKTAAGRLIALAAALDPITELHTWCAKGGSDWRAFTQVAHRAGFGPRSEVAAALLADLRDIQRRMNTRYDTIARLGPELCPDSQVTRDLAERRGLGLWPILITIDEFQRYTAHPEHGAGIVEVLLDIAKIGPAVGISLVLMTQKPDSDSIPSALRDVLGTRFALHVRAWQASDCILGAGAHTEGYDSSQFRRSDKGVGWLVGADDTGAVEDASIVRTYYVNTLDCGPILDRARAVRTQSGLLTGLAAGESAPVMVQDRTAVLVDVLTIWPAGPHGPTDKVANARLAGLLADYSSRYEGWSGSDLTAALGRHGITTVQVNRLHGADDRRNLRGTARTDVEDALQRANGGQPAGGPNAPGSGPGTGQK